MHFDLTNISVWQVIFIGACMGIGQNIGEWLYGLIRDVMRRNGRSGMREKVEGEPHFWKGLPRTSVKNSPPSPPIRTE